MGGTRLSPAHSAPSAGLFLDPTGHVLRRGQRHCQGPGFNSVLESLRGNLWFCGPCNPFPLTVSLDLRLPFCKMEPTLTDVCFCKKSSQIFENSRVLSGRISVYGTEGHRSLLPGSVRGLRCGPRLEGSVRDRPCKDKCASHRVCRWPSPCLLPSHLLDSRSQECWRLCCDQPRAAVAGLGDSCGQDGRFVHVDGPHPLEQGLGLPPTSTERPCVMSVAINEC